jgi:hypothetical protein
MLNRARVSISILALTMTAAGVAHSQSGADVFERMLSEYEQRMANVENYTVVQETMGVETVSYFERRMVDGRSVFRMVRTEAGGVAVTESEDDSGWDEFYTMAPQMMARAAYQGRETVDGHSVHVVAVNDLHELDFGMGSSQDDTDFQPERGTFYVDTETWVARRMIFEGRMTTDGETHDIKSIADFGDFREVDGMLHPFHLSVTMEGLGEAMGPEMQEQLAEMKKQLEQLPESQRAMAEEMMKGQMAQFEQMMGSEGGMKVEIRVIELKVNSGPGGD